MCMISLSQDNFENIHTLKHSSDRILQHFNIETQANEFSQILVSVLMTRYDSIAYFCCMILALSQRQI
jgi:hypothetical protein